MRKDIPCPPAEDKRTSSIDTHDDMFRWDQDGSPLSNEEDL